MLCHISNLRRLVYFSTLWTLELSQKKSLKRITKWKASYFTHPVSYYAVPQISKSLSAAKFITSLPAESIPMKESAEHYRLVGQRTVRSETTKDKTGALPPAVYKKAKTGTWSELSFPDNCAKSSTTSVSNESVLLSTSSDCTVVTFVVTRKFPKSSSALSLNLSTWMNLKVTRAVTMMKQNQRRL